MQILNTNNLSVNTDDNKDTKVDKISEKRDEKKDALSSKPTIPNKSPKPSPRDKSMKKSSSDDIASKDAKSKGGDVPVASNESSYSQIMKYLKTSLQRQFSGDGWVV